MTRDRSLLSIVSLLIAAVAGLGAATGCFDSSSPAATTSNELAAGPNGKGDGSAAASRGNCLDESCFRCAPSASAARYFVRHDQIRHAEGCGVQANDDYASDRKDRQHEDSHSRIYFAQFSTIGAVAVCLGARQHAVLLWSRRAHCTTASSCRWMMATRPTSRHSLWLLKACFRSRRLHGPEGKCLAIYHLQADKVQ